MKCVILAGGFGTRISEESYLRPKPMIEIGGRPILWHLMKGLSTYGINEFVICLGYKGYIIKEYFSNLRAHEADLYVDIEAGRVDYISRLEETWKIWLVDTGENTMTGGRLKRVSHLLDQDSPFLFTYGDGLSNINIHALVDLHRKQKCIATVTAVQPPGRYGALIRDGVKVTGFREKPAGDGGWINGGFFVLRKSVVDYIQDDATIWESTPLEQIALDGQLSCYEHRGFWHAMDTLRDKKYLEELWVNGAPWRTWK